MANTKKVKLSIIILNWNTKELLRQCLKSLGQRCRAEIIVVDNGSTDGSQKYLKAQSSKLKTTTKNLKLKIILNRENLGFARGNNQALRQALYQSGTGQAQGEYIMLLNSDTVVREGAIEKLIEFMEKNPAVGAVSPLLLHKDNTPQIDYYMKFPNLWQIFLYHNPILRPIALKIPLFKSLICFFAKEEIFQVDQLPGAALMARREVWEKIGLLDEDYHFLFEDVDWCYRAKSTGYQLAVVSEAKIVHFGGASWKAKLEEDSSRFYRQFFSSMLLFVRKNYGERRFQIFQAALVLNFLLQFKLRLALHFLTKKDPAAQENLWQ